MRGQTLSCTEHNYIVLQTTVQHTTALNTIALHTSVLHTNGLQTIVLHTLVLHISVLNTTVHNSIAHKCTAHNWTSQKSTAKNCTETELHTVHCGTFAVLCKKIYVYISQVWSLQFFVVVDIFGLMLFSKMEEEKNSEGKKSLYRHIIQLKQVGGEKHKLTFTVVANWNSGQIFITSIHISLIIF